MEALSHLCLDEARGSRLAELLALQLVGILAGQASRNDWDFEFLGDFPAPSRIDFDGRGSLTAPGQDQTRRVEVKAYNGALSVETNLWRCELPNAPVGGHFENALQVVDGTSLGYVYASLCRPEFQPFPQLQGSAGNQAWVAQLRQSWKALELSGIPNVKDHLSWCKSLIGLVSMTGAIGSASREEALGLIYLPAGASDTDLAECLLHESLHQVLFRLEEAVSLFDAESPAAPTYYSPWRTDGRPLRMVLHGAFVFAGVARLHRLWSEQPGADFAGSRETACRRAVESQQALEAGRVGLPAD
jgi:HEXXH motif-containing protein